MGKNFHADPTNLVLCRGKQRL